MPVPRRLTKAALLGIAFLVGCNLEPTVRRSRALYELEVDIPARPGHGQAWLITARLQQYMYPIYWQWYFRLVPVTHWHFSESGQARPGRASESLRLAAAVTAVARLPGPGPGLRTRAWQRGRCRRAMAQCCRFHESRVTTSDLSDVGPCQWGRPRKLT